MKDLNNKVEKAIEERREANRPIWKLIRLIKQNPNLTDLDKEGLLGRLYGTLSSQDLRENHIYDAHKYEVGISYRADIFDIQRTKRLMRSMGTDIFPGNNPKIRDHAFAQALGIPVPRTFHQDVALNALRLRANSILKPVEGAASKAVFFVDQNLDLHSVKSSKVYPTLHHAKEEIEIHSDSISVDRWILEQAVTKDDGTPGNDFKVYAFYGVIGMYLEIDRFSFPETRYATYNAAGEQIERGGNYISFKGNGIPPQLRNLAERLSLASPVPTLRIDFLQGGDGLYLGEITPHPGGVYAGSQSEKIDKMLGHYLAEARARLLIDLLNGKKFPEYFSAYPNHASM